MKKNKIVITLILIAFFLIYLSLNYNTYGFDPGAWNPIDGVSLEGGDVIKDIGDIIIGGVALVGSAISVITILIIAIKYMLGSVEEKADYKKTMVPYIIGAIMVFGISNIVNILYQLGTSIMK